MFVAAIFFFIVCFIRYLMDDAESSSESEMELGDQSEEDDNIAVNFLFVF